MRTWKPRPGDDTQEQLYKLLNDNVTTATSRLRGAQADLDTVVRARDEAVRQHDAVVRQYDQRLQDATRDHRRAVALLQEVTGL